MNSSADHRAGPDAQREAIAFLADPASYPQRPATVERRDTHGAMVFLAGDRALKMKRAVRLPYLDFSTLDRRRTVLDRELAVNRPHAPEIYLGLSALTREPGGRLAFDGPGEPIEWVLVMRRFDDSALLSEVVKTVSIDGKLARELAVAVHRFHATAAVGAGIRSADHLGTVAHRVAQSLARAPTGEAQDAAERFSLLAERQLERARVVLEKRSAAGFVRRCHGDLHLGNIVLWQGAPVLFDAIEFDESLAVVDTLYDLAFLLMDLCIEDERPAANVVLNRYLWLTQEMLDLEGLVALPLMLALRAGIRAMVAADRARQLVPAEAVPLLLQCRRYTEAALAHLEPPPAQLIAVGGLSGTGKTTLAARLAPDTGRAPGAIHLRSDLERKAMAGVAETHRLPAKSYTAEASAAVYRRLMEKAELVLRAGHSVIVDAVFAAAPERDELESLADHCSVPFQGIWLTAPPEVLTARVDQRHGDASDATADVIARQLSYDTGRIGWSVIDASLGPGATLDKTRAALSPPS